MSLFVSRIQFCFYCYCDYFLFSFSFLLQKGLRVRMGIHNGAPSAEEDPVTGRMDYFGPMVNRAARVESVASGGQIVMSGDVYEKVKSELPKLSWAPVVLDLGDFELKGLADATHIWQVLPLSLSERKFEAVVSKEQELQEEKKKLQEQLFQLQKKNELLADELKTIETEVHSQLDSAQRLLVSVQEAQAQSVEPDANIVQGLRGQMEYLRRQTTRIAELQKEQSLNSQILKETKEAAQRRDDAARGEITALEIQNANLNRHMDKVLRENMLLESNKQEAELRIKRLNDRIAELEEQVRAAALGRQELLAACNFWALEFAMQTLDKKQLPTTLTMYLQDLGSRLGTGDIKSFQDYVRLVRQAVMDASPRAPPTDDRPPHPELKKKLTLRVLVDSPKKHQSSTDDHGTTSTEHTSWGKAKSASSLKKSQSSTEKKW